MNTDFPIKKSEFISVNVRQNIDPLPEEKEKVLPVEKEPESPNLEKRMQAVAYECFGKLVQETHASLSEYTYKEVKSSQDLTEYFKMVASEPVHSYWAHLKSNFDRFLAAIKEKNS